MPSPRNDFDEHAYNPQFQWAFLHPKYWGTWLLLLLSCLLSLLPFFLKRAFAKSLAKLAVSVKGGANHRARVNLELCFPEKSPQEREQWLENMYVTAIAFLLTFPLLTLRSRTRLENHTQVRGIEHLTQVLDRDEKVILLVPHTWAIDIPAVLLASRGMPVSAMAKQQRN